MDKQVTKTIGRNSRKLIDGIFGSVISIRYYTLENYFAGEQHTHAAVQPGCYPFHEQVSRLMADVLKGDAKLVQLGTPRHYKVRHHSNRWAEILTAEPCAHGVTRVSILEGRPVCYACLESSIQADGAVRS